MIGDTIKRLREERGWTQEELATRMGYTSKSTINKIEKNINDVTQTKIHQFARVFNCDVTEMIINSPTAVSEPDTAYVLQSNGKYDAEVEKAKELYEQYQNLPPDKQAAFLNYLKFLQSET